MNNGAPNQETEPVTKEQVVQALRENTPEARELLLQWTIAREAQVQNSIESRIHFELDRADLYLQAGLVEDFDLSVDAALMQAENEQRPDIAEKIIEWAKQKSP